MLGVITIFLKTIGNTSMFNLSKFITSDPKGKCKYPQGIAVITKKTLQMLAYLNLYE